MNWNDEIEDEQENRNFGVFQEDIEIQDDRTVAAFLNDSNDDNKDSGMEKTKGYDGERRLETVDEYKLN